MVRAARPHQWSKNVLVFAPPLLAHHLQPAVLGKALLAFLAFGCVASSGYVLNDLVDLEADRAHPEKRLRPFASGALPIPVAWVFGPALLLAGFALAALVTPALVLVLAGYLGATVLYSSWLKRRVVADVIGLAGLYTLRLFAGAAATGAPVSEWFAIFSMFLFTSLALVKRAAELHEAEGDVAGRGYVAADREVVLGFGAASASGSVLVLALYVNSPEVRRLYAHPGALWVLCPLALYWTARLWIDARRGLITGDPLHHALTQRVTWVVGAIAGAVLVAGSGALGGW